MLSPERLSRACEAASAQLLAMRGDCGHWVGALASSALSTATGVLALAVAGRTGSNSPGKERRLSGLEWLARHQNQDGGWGDTVLSRSNISTTTLCWAAFGACRDAVSRLGAASHKAEDWIEAYLRKRAERDASPGSRPGNRDGLSDRHHELARAIIARYGQDRTFSVPILTACALSGRFGTGPAAWEQVIQLPFELAALPRSWFGAMRLPVVSYALPALIAMGYARHQHRPARIPLLRWLRDLIGQRTLGVLQEVQPSTGGFLEAIPLTSFVVMSLAGSGQADHPVVRSGLRFLEGSQRADGSWAIDTNLATWVTTLSVEALGEAAKAGGEPTLEWLLSQQYRTRHLYTMAQPGAWAWTDLPGAVPDADDTAGALLALRRLSPEGDPRAQHAAMAGVDWLVQLQNRDGGIPTFCRGWGTQPFDRSSADITAHAIRAWLNWLTEATPEQQRRILRAIRRAVDFLVRTQKADGSWLPLWFGNEQAPGEANPVYGTARVLQALMGATGFARRTGMNPFFGGSEPLDRAVSLGVAWLVAAQNKDGGWGGEGGVRSSVEETGLAVEALADESLTTRPGVTEGVLSGAKWLVERVETGEWKQPSPIGFYFANLWYYEQLYPMIFATAGLRRVSQCKGRLLRA